MSVTTQSTSFEQAWPALLVHINRYAAAMTDAAMHQAASRSDIAQSQALVALQQLRAAILQMIDQLSRAPVGAGIVEPEQALTCVADPECPTCDGEGHLGYGGCPDCKGTGHG